MLRTKSGLPKHCCWTTDRHGKQRVRFRKRGFSTYLTGTPWSEEFMRQYAAAVDGVKDQATDIGAERTIPGSFNALAVAYYKSADFNGLAPISQRNRRNIIDRLRNEHGDKPVARLEKRHIQEWRDAKASTPAAANVLIKTVRLMLNHAADIGMIPTNPAIGVKLIRAPKGEGFHPWSEDEAAQFEARHPIGSRARLAMSLLLYTAQRRSDVVRMGWQHLQGSAIKVRQQKTGKPLLIPLHPDLASALASVPKDNMTFLVTGQGAPFTAGGFSGWFRKRCDEAGLADCSAHGLRKLAATRLAEAGCTPAMIMAVTGHSSLSEVLRYTEAADQKRLAEQALARQLGSNREQEIVQPALPVGQKG
jgi:integrase